MKINFNWKYSVYEKPKYDEQVIIFIHQRLVQGKITSDNYGGMQIHGHQLNDSLQRSASCMYCLNDDREFF